MQDDRNILSLTVKPDGRAWLWETNMGDWYANGTAGSRMAAYIRANEVISLELNRRVMAAIG